jgi:hypothetical protein
LGFQSDIYLGWVGKQRIIDVLGISVYESHLPKGEHAVGGGDVAGASEAVVAYLSAKYGAEKLRFGRERPSIYELLEWEFEGEDVGEDNHVFGVPLTSRYFPTFLDFAHEHGGLYVKRFGQSLFDDVEWFREFLVNAGKTHYESAEVFVKDHWY